ncbi:MAG: hypothetical protein J5858_06340, partial [Lentisphaeria bacterium]|nr:hypothetical protein [Lentisphaeria bacterium]
KCFLKQQQEQSHKTQQEQCIKKCPAYRPIYIFLFVVGMERHGKVCIDLVFCTCLNQNGFFGQKPYFKI